MRTQSHNWSNRSYLPLPYNGFTIASPNRVLIIGASKARKARLKKTISAAATTTTTTHTIPAENHVAMKLLDSWLSNPVADNEAAWEEFKQTVDSHRATERKLYS